MIQPGPGVPPRPLLVLCVLVGMLHAVALQSAPATISWLQARKAPPPRAVEAPVTIVTARLAEPGGPVEAPARRSVAPPARPAPPRSTQEPALRTTPIEHAAPTAAPSAESPAAPIALPGSARWHYAVTALRHGAVVAGRAELSWWHDGRRYEASLRIDAPPLPARLQRSTGTLQPDGLAPTRYSDRLRSEEAAHFDRQAGRIVFSSQAATAGLQPGAQDRLSVLLQLAAVLAARPQGWREGDSFLVQTATTREAGEWRFTVEGIETLALPAGATAALKLVRPPRHEWDARWEAWFVPGGDYGPVRLRLTPPNGEWLDMQWSGTDKG